jgi:hypothetical protein
MYLRFRHGQPGTRGKGYVHSLAQKVSEKS